MAQAVPSLLGIPSPVVATDESILRRLLEPQQHDPTAGISFSYDGRLNALQMFAGSQQASARTSFNAASGMLGALATPTARFAAALPTSAFDESRMMHAIQEQKNRNQNLFLHQYADRAADPRHLLAMMERNSLGLGLHHALLSSAPSLEIFPPNALGQALMGAAVRWPLTATTVTNPYDLLLRNASLAQGHPLLDNTDKTSTQ